MNTSVLTRGAPATAAPVVLTPGMPGSGLPSSAINVNPVTGFAVAVINPAPVKPVVCDPTIAGTCMRRPAFTRRTRTVPVPGIPEVAGTAGVPVTPAVAANSE